MSYINLRKNSDGEAITMAREHNLTHEGKSFRAFHNHSSLGSGSTINIFFTTASTPNVNLIFNISGSVSFDFELLEAPTVTSNTGTHGQAVINKNRNSATASTVLDNATSPESGVFTIDATVTADGTIIASEVFGSNKGGGDYSLTREMILKSSTAYVFRLTSQDAGNRVHINLDWYED
jgi:hypothetical protein